MLLPTLMLMVTERAVAGAALGATRTKSAKIEMMNARRRMPLSSFCPMTLWAHRMRRNP